MDFTQQIENALADEAERQRELLAEKEAAANDRIRQKEKQAEVFRTYVIPILESARKQLTEKGIDASCTNGEDAKTRQIRHGLTLRWRAGQHSVVFTAAADNARILVTFSTGGSVPEELPGVAYDSTLKGTEDAVARFFHFAFMWLPG